MDNKLNIDFINSYNFISVFVDNPWINAIISNHCGENWKGFITFNELITLLDTHKDIIRSSKMYFHFSECINSVAMDYIDKPINVFLNENLFCITEGLFQTKNFK